jgi:hypothetical protein
VQTNLKLPQLPLNADQTAVEAQVRAFLANPSQTTFSLQGGAGVGKTYLLAALVQRLLAAGYTVVVGAPTHKACKVLRRKLSDYGVRWSFKPGKRKDSVIPKGVAIVDTTAALIGLRPVVAEDQTADEVLFAASQSGGSLPKYLAEGNGKTILVLDEISMVSADALAQLSLLLKAGGSKLLVSGDEGQLPPVKAKRIDFSKGFDVSVTMDRVMRQAEGSRIVGAAWAIRRGEEWQGHLGQSGGGIIVTEGNVEDAYVEAVQTPSVEEGQRSVFIGYKNDTVRRVNERCCAKLYGHGAGAFKSGELVLATTPGYQEVRPMWNGRPSKFTTMEPQCAVADQLRVLSFDLANEDPILGVPVELERLDAGPGERKTFSSYYLAPEFKADPSHAYNVELRRLKGEAECLQGLFNAAKSEGRPAEALTLDPKRKDAWGAFFKHQQRVLGFAHPFAITSHKSQGSTYRAVYAAVAELAAFNRAALYVAVTRPSETLYT